jgi:hypothetical protein
MMTAISLTEKSAVSRRLWKAFRIQKRTDAKILGLAANAADTTAREFLGLLKRAGYVEIVTHGNSRTGAMSIYRIVRDTGPAHPIRVFDALYDRNTKLVHPLAPAQRNKPGALDKRPSLVASGGGTCLLGQAA